MPGPTYVTSEKGDIRDGEAADRQGGEEMGSTEIAEIAKEFPLFGLAEKNLFMLPFTRVWNCLGTRSCDLYPLLCVQEQAGFHGPQERGESVCMHAPEHNKAEYECRTRECGCKTSIAGSAEKDLFHTTRGICRQH